MKSLSVFQSRMRRELSHSTRLQINVRYNTHSNFPRECFQFWVSQQTLRPCLVMEDSTTAIDSGARIPIGHTVLGINITLTADDAHNKKMHA